MKMCLPEEIYNDHPHQGPFQAQHHCCDNRMIYHPFFRMTYEPLRYLVSRAYGLTILPCVESVSARLNTCESTRGHRRRAKTIVVN